MAKEYDTFTDDISTIKEGFFRKKVEIGCPV